MFQIRARGERCSITPGTIENEHGQKGFFFFYVYSVFDYRLANMN